MQTDPAQKTTLPAPKTSRLLSRETLRIAALALAVTLLWCWFERRWTAEQWQTPVEYLTLTDVGSVDVMAQFAAIKTTADGYCFPFMSKQNPWLGAPYGANWDDYPSNEQFQYFLAGMLADTIGIFAAANFWLLLLCVLSAISFYFVCRKFRVAWQWAFAGGLVFAFTPFAFGHWMHHLTVTSYWHIPLCLLVCTWAARGSGIRMGKPGFRFAMVVAVLTGMQNVYYAAMFVQLLGIACLLQWLRGRKTAAVMAVVTGTVTVATFLLMSASTFIYHLHNGPNMAAVNRKYFEIEWTSMKFVDFFMPWTHRLPGFATWAHTYLAGAWIKGESPPSNYLGFAGLAALVWLVLRLLRRLVLLRPAKPLPLEAIFFAWIFFYATVGGFNGLLGAMGFVLFRAPARYSIILLCILLLFLMRRLSSLTKHKSLAVTAALAALLAAVALWDQVPPLKTAQDLARTQEFMDSDRRFTEELEKRLPDEAMIFQVPVMDYPEHPNATIPSYDHFRPYIYSTKLRFSFGSDKGRPTADWQHEIENLSLDEMIARLEHLGFSAIFVNRRGVNDLGKGMLRDFPARGYGDIILSPNKDLFCVMLHPVPKEQRVWPLGEKLQAPK